MQKKILITVFILTAFFTKAQVKRAAHWCFGYRAGLDFSSGSAIADTTRMLISLEGCSAISDTLGNLLFYSNGEQAWNRNGAIMLNGNNLIGDQSSEQSSLIVPMPDNNSIYYLFTTKYDYGAIGLQYNIVDMSLDSGFGAIIASAKNITLVSPTSEELAATKHCNNHDYWIVARQAVKDTLVFYAYLLANGGLSAPVISRIPTIIMQYDFQSGLTFSQDGNLLVQASSGTTDIRLLDFNKQTGKIILRENIPMHIGEGVYSTALSPDASKLYAVSLMPNFSFISQFDLSSGNIAASRQILDSIDFYNLSAYGYGQIRLAPDQKIYFSRWRQGYWLNPNFPYGLDSLGVIDAPNSLAPLCNYQRAGLCLNKRPTEYGLPNFVGNFTTVENKSNTCNATPLIDYPSQFISVKVYPNPFSDKAIIKIFKSDITDLKLKMTNVLGEALQLIFTELPDGFLLDRNNISPGIYYLTLYDKKQLLAEQKIIISN